MSHLDTYTPAYRRHKPTNKAVVTLSGNDHYLGKWRTKAPRDKYDRLVGECWPTVVAPWIQPTPV
jgi:hypothetical protein